VIPEDPSSSGALTGLAEGIDPASPGSKPTKAQAEGVKTVRAATFLTKAWLEVTGSANTDLVTVQATHRLSPDLQRLFGATMSSGK